MIITNKAQVLDMSRTLDSVSLVTESQKNDILKISPYLETNTFKRPDWCGPEGIQEKNAIGCNIFWTLNSDNRLTWNVYDLSTHNSKLYNIFLYARSIQLLTKVICVYEYGKGGKDSGKLHYHFLTQLNSSLDNNARDKFRKLLLKNFNKRAAVRHRTVNDRLIVDVSDRKRLILYMKKESQNRQKCGYSFA